MIVFLVLCYIALLMALLKFGIITPSIGWKISPVLFGLVCMVALILPMQWGAPSGTVNVYRYVIEVVPNVSGQVTDVPAQPLEPMKRGDVLFQIDPRPFESEISQLEAALKQARQSARMLPAELTSAKATVAQAEAAITDAKQQAESLHAELDVAEAAVDKAESEIELAQANFDRTKKLFSEGVVTEFEFDTLQRNLETAQATFDEVEAEREQAELAFRSQVGGVNTIVIHAEQSLRAAEAMEAKAQLALDSTIEGENTEVAQLLAQLEMAKLNLDWATVRAPADGYVIQLALRPGQRVMNSPVRSWLAYVEQEKTRTVVWIKQSQLRHVKPGQPVEVEFKLYPGQTFAAKVDAILSMNAMGQMQATGKVGDPLGAARPLQEYGVILTFDEDAEIEVAELPGGAIGKAAIYTEQAKATHFIRRVEMRMKSWLNYIIL